MTKKEILVQKALGTLPYKEWMKLHYYKILFKDNWWYFPIDRYSYLHKAPEIITLRHRGYYPVSNRHIDNLYRLMAGNKWTEKKFAEKVIKQCYLCICTQTLQDFK